MLGSLVRFSLRVLMYVSCVCCALCNTKILLEDFKAKVGRDDTFKPTTGNESLHQENNENGVRIVKFSTSKNLVVNSTMFPHRNIFKHNWTSPNGKSHIHFDRRRQSNILDVRSFRGADCDTDHYLVVAKIGERLAVSKQEPQKLDGVRFNLRNLRELEVKKQY